jgi:hypothetical protein
MITRDYTLGFMTGYSHPRHNLRGIGPQSYLLLIVGGTGCTEVSARKDPNFLLADHSSRTAQTTLLPVVAADQISKA